MREYGIESAWNDAGTIYFGDDDSIRFSIAKVLPKIPNDVRDYVLNECFIFSAGKGDFGVTWPASMILNSYDRLRSWIIILSEDMPEDDKDSIIAHEIAHAYLKHDRLSDVPVEVEKDACLLVKGWGFDGLGTNLEHCYEAFRKPGM